jgi:hypothetical protein
MSEPNHDKIPRDVELTVNKHIALLRELASKREISEQDHDLIGSIMQAHLSQMITLSDKAWETFKLIVDESRFVHYRKL